MYKITSVHLSLRSCLVPRLMVSISCVSRLFLYLRPFRFQSLDTQFFVLRKKFYKIHIIRQRTEEEYIRTRGLYQLKFFTYPVIRCGNLKRERINIVYVYRFEYSYYIFIHLNLTFGLYGPPLCLLYVVR